jgi:hypothetical protein
MPTQLIKQTNTGRGPAVSSNNGHAQRRFRKPSPDEMLQYVDMVCGPGHYEYDSAFFPHQRTALKTREINGAIDCK